VNNRLHIFSLLLLTFTLTVTVTVTGCIKDIRIDELPIDTAPEPEEEREEEFFIVPEVEPEIDYETIELEIVEIRQMIEKAGPYNTFNPRFSSDESYIAVEINLETFNKIYIYSMIRDDAVGDIGISFRKILEVYLESSTGETLLEDLLEGPIQESFNYEFDWFPRSSSFIFTSNAGVGDYNIYVGAVELDDRTLMHIQQKFQPKSYGKYFTMTEEVKKDGQSRVSPDGTKIVFTSGRTGNGDLYLLNLENGTLRRLTYSDNTDFFPEWSPDGNEIVFTTGGQQSHDIHVIRGVDTDKEREEVLVRWFFDDVLPKFSPDGKMISFYTTYNLERDPFNNKRWGLMIIPSDGSAPQVGKGLLDYFHLPDVVKDNTQGTAWFPDSTHIIYAKNIESDFNPIYIYNTENRQERFIQTNTSINHDITVSPHGMISFRAQVFGWDRIFIATTTYFQEYIKELERN
jgi:Tol biopolymer transport system component